MYNSTHGSKYKYNSKYKYKYRYKYKYKYKCRHRYKIVSDCLACMTTHAIERASRSVVRQVPGGRFLSAYAVFLALFEKLGQDGPR